MNITQFQANFAGGGARPNLFKVEGVFPISTDPTAAQSLPFLCKAAQLPTSNLGVINVPFRGRTLKIGGDKTFEPWTITILNDIDFKIRSSFERWMELINANASNIGINTPSAYFAEWKVHQLDRAGVEIETYKFVNCFPTNIAAIDLSADSNDTVEEFTVTLEYQYFTHSSNTIGDVVSASVEAAQALL